MDVFHSITSSELSDDFENHRPTLTSELSSNDEMYLPMQPTSNKGGYFTKTYEENVVPAFPKRPVIVERTEEGIYHLAGTNNDEIYDLSCADSCGHEKSQNFTPRTLSSYFSQRRIGLLDGAILLFLTIVIVSLLLIIALSNKEDTLDTIVMIATPSSRNEERPDTFQLKRRQNSRQG